MVMQADVDLLWLKVLSDGTFQELQEKNSNFHLPANRLAVKHPAVACHLAGGK